jgi:hypothetical protein
VSLLRAASDRLPGMLARPGQLTGWTAQHLRHAAALVRPGANPAARVYESIGADFFLALAPGWLNLGLWEGPGSEARPRPPAGGWWQRSRRRCLPGA